MDNRPSRDATFMLMVGLLAQRGSCGRMQVGAMIVKEGKHITSSGVNGPSGLDCKDRKCDLTKPCQHAVHAEANAIHFAARYGIRLNGTTLYCTHQPCLDCAALIIEAGISRVVYKEPYRLVEGLELLRKYEIEVIQIP